jgi:1-acyl-sn-glycerol-3-phosphate acyltransferase
MRDDPVADRSAVLFRAFALYLRWYFWRHFRAVRVARGGLPVLPPGRPAIIYTNHPSWWDPAVFILLSDTLLRGRPGFGPMAADALGRYGLLRRMGVFGIDLDSPRGAARFMQVGLRVLRDPRHVLWITAEGAFTDPRTRPVRLRPGIAHLARRAENAVVLPMALDYAFWNERKPEALVRFGPPIACGKQHSLADWTVLLEARLAETMDALAADSAARRPAAFLPILAGAGGVGGIYDVWRRARAWSHGERARLEHEEQAD